MPQGVLPFEYEIDQTAAGMTSYAGLPVYLDLAHIFRLTESIWEHVKVRTTQGYNDAQMILSLVLLNLAGGEVVDDVECLEHDKGFAELLKKVELHGLPRAKKRALLLEWRKARTRTVPSPSAVFRYLEAFHDPVQEDLRKEAPNKAFIPSPSAFLRGLARVNADLAARIQEARPERVATLDQDATLIKTHKKVALHCYKSFKAYQPLNVWWAEHHLMLHTEFRDGNVPADLDNLRVLQEALEMLPEGVEEVRYRSDCAGYQVKLMRYCAQGKHPKYGRIGFSISVPVEKSFKSSVAEMEQLHAAEVCPRGKKKVSPWTPIYRVEGKKWVPSGQEWAEIYHEPDWQTKSRRQRIQIRYFAIREPFEERALPGLEDEHQQKLPFQTMTMGTKTYKLFGMVTNRKGDPESLIRWHRERCGKSEEAHAVLKDDQAGGRLPSSKFGVNAAWWWIANLAANLNTALKRIVLAKIDEGWVARRMKAIRFHIINVAGRVVRHSRRWIVRLARGHPSTDLLLRARAIIASLAAA